MIDLTNKGLRTKLRKAPHSVLSHLEDDVDVIVKTNSKKTTYIVFPDLTSDMDIKTLSELDAAGVPIASAGSFSSVGSVSTFSCPASSLTSLASVGTASSS